MKRFLIVVVGLAIIALGTYFFTSKSFSPLEKVSTLIPETGLFTLHLEGFSSSIEKIQNFTNYDLLPKSRELLAFKSRLDSLEKDGSIPKSMLDLDTWISVHSNGSDGLNNLYLMSSNGFDWDQENIIRVFNLVFNDSFNTEIQTFNDREISLLKGQDVSLAFGFENGFLFWSEESVLVEDVIRAIEEPSARFFGDEKLDNKTLKKILHINGNRLNELSRVFLNQPDVGLEKTNLIYSIDVLEDEGRLNFTGLTNRNNNRSAEVSLLGSILFHQNQQ